MKCTNPEDGGGVKRIIMGLDRNTRLALLDYSCTLAFLMRFSSINRTPCGFCFVEFYTHAEALAALRYVSGTKLDERIVRCDMDLGYTDGRQFGRGKSGGQVGPHCRRCVSVGADILLRFGMSTGKIMMPEEVDGVLKHKGKKNCERSCMQTRSMRLVLWLVEEAIGKIETEVSSTTALQSLWPMNFSNIKILILRKKLTSSGNAKRTRTTQMKSDG